MAAEGLQKKDSRLLYFLLGVHAATVSRRLEQAEQANV
jgi:hypothetical protein